MIVERGPFLHVEEERDKTVTIYGNGLEVVVVANEDGSLFIEAGAQDRSEQAVVQEVAIDRYRTVYPHFRLGIAKRPVADPKPVALDEDGNVVWRAEDTATDMEPGSLYTEGLPPTPDEAAEIAAAGLTVNCAVCNLLPCDRCACHEDAALRAAGIEPRRSLD